MARRYQPVDLSGLRTYSARRRRHKARLDDAAKLPPPGASFREWLESWPDYLGAKSFRAVAQAVVSAVRADRPVVAAFGAHVIKVGCGSILIDLIRRGVVRAICCNGACAIHDFELASMGQTSEEVADTIRDGAFGMVQETLDFFDGVGRLAEEGEGIGLGEAVGRLAVQRKLPFLDQGIFAAAYQAAVPATVHVALGTDTVHVSPGADGAALGKASMRDFRLICDVVGDLGAENGGDVGGVWLNIGSAVVLPEVFLKAVSVARNLGANLDAMVTANMDMIRHYRPNQNVVTRPVQKEHGHDIIGHHEIMLPLLRQAVITLLDE